MPTVETLPGDWKHAMTVSNHAHKWHRGDRIAPDGSYARILIVPETNELQEPVGHQWYGYTNGLGLADENPFEFETRGDAARWAYRVMVDDVDDE